LDWYKAREETAEDAEAKYRLDAIYAGNQAPSLPQFDGSPN
jgi:hypothetical protein